MSGKRERLWQAGVAATLLTATIGGASAQEFRPPAVPLVTHDPLFSIWSQNDKLTDGATKHWTNREHALVSLIRIDGNAFRLMGNDPESVPALPQTGLKVTPTRSIYDFQNAAVHVTLTFTTPVLPDDLDILTRPVTYLTWDVNARDGKAHRVGIYDSTSSQLAVNQPSERVTWQLETMGTLTALRVGTEEQTYLRPAGDDARINWGYAYAAASKAQSRAAIGANGKLLAGWVKDGTLPKQDETGPRAVSEETPVLAFSFDLGSVSAKPVSRRLMVAYDEVYAIKFFSERLRPYWRRNGATPATMLPLADRQYADLTRRCVVFDAKLTADMTRAGGAPYAQIAALAYRQGLAGCGFAADSNKMPLIFAKENTSNGCIATTDVFYPAAPQFLLLSPALAKGLVAPVLVYSASPRWKFPFAPHDIGVYPQATGQVYGGGETSTNEGDMMPVEESGNMLILCDAIAQMDGNADFVSKWWPQLTAWEKYLEKYGYDPEDQLCTDDFMGHLAHNANLSVKAILAIAAYGDLCRMRGDAASAEKYQKLAKSYAAHWMDVAGDGDHSRLAFDKPNSWSQKYNLVWDKLLNLNVFPDSVARQEVAYYKKVLQPYGIPLDSRTRQTKADWSLWSATMAENRTDFEAFVSPIYDYLNATTARMAFADQYVTDDIKSSGMHARPVIGGVFVKMLADPTVRKRYAAAGAKASGAWAAAPPSPVVTELVPTSQKTALLWRSVTEKPAENWTKPDFDDSSWKESKGGFGTGGTPGAVIGTEWKTGDIWIRRTLILPAGDYSSAQLLLHHDEDAEVYINGVLAAREGGYTGSYEPSEIRPAARALLVPGAKITLAVHCHQTTGGQFIDVGLANVK